MKQDLIPLITCTWCGVILGGFVTVVSYDTPSFIGSALCTALALTLAVSVTSEYRKS